MKLTFALLLSCLVCACTALLTEESPSLTEKETAAKIKRRVLVLPFLDKSDFSSPELTQQASADIRRAIEREEELQYVDAEEIEGHEAFITDKARYNERVILETAKARGFCAVVLGSIEDVAVEEKSGEVGFFRTRQYHSRATVRFRLFDIGTEREIASLTNSGEAEEEHTQFLGGLGSEPDQSTHAKEAVSKALEKILANFPTYAKRIPWSGRVAKVEYQRFYVTTGEESGIRPGHLLKVFSESFPVTDSKTGTLLGMASGSFKAILKVVDFLGPGAVVAVLHSGAGVKEQDRVELLKEVPQ